MLLFLRSLRGLHHIQPVRRDREKPLVHRQVVVIAAQMASVKVAHCVTALHKAPRDRARVNASTARPPDAQRVTPEPGDLPIDPSGRSNLILPRVNMNASARSLASCHHGADVRSGVSAIPLPWAKNLSNQGASEFRPPNGGFIQTKPCHISARLFSCIQDPQGTCRGPMRGAATSRSKPSSKASNTKAGVYHSSDAPMVSHLLIASPPWVNGRPASNQQ